MKEILDSDTKLHQKTDAHFFFFSAGKLHSGFLLFFGQKMKLNSIFSISLLTVTIISINCNEYTETVVDDAERQKAADFLCESK